MCGLQESGTIYRLVVGRSENYNDTELKRWAENRSLK
jgi:hypothetical protein